LAKVARGLGKQLVGLLTNRTLRNPNFNESFQTWPGKQLFNSVVSNIESRMTPHNTIMQSSSDLGLEAGGITQPYSFLVSIQTILEGKKLSKGDWIVNLAKSF
jgi:hypothetical protein